MIPQIKHFPTFDELQKMFNKSNQNNIYKKVLGKNGRTYYYTLNVNSPIAVTPINGDMNGCAGRTIYFPLEDGTTDQVVAPWFINSDDLFEQTDIDLRELYASFVVITPESEKLYVNNVFGKDVEVYYMDDEPIVGSYYRWLIIAKQIFENDSTVNAIRYFSYSGGYYAGYLHRDKLQEYIDNVNTYSFISKELSPEKKGD